MELETPRLRMRHWRAEDRAPFIAMNCEPEVLRYLPPITAAASDALLDRFDAHFAHHGFGIWALEERASGALIGACGLQHVPFDLHFTPAVEIGWRLATAWHGKGLAREAAEAALGAAFGPLALPRIVSFTVPANRASWGLMERLGMRRVGMFDHPKLPEGDRLRQHVLYEVTAAEVRSGR
jgi:RimJ/RimL family protein N-acetyltransferase